MTGAESGMEDNTGPESMIRTGLQEMLRFI